MHEYHSQHRVVTYYSYTSFVVFLAKHVGKHSSGTFYVAFRDPGQILGLSRRFRDSWSLCVHKMYSYHKPTNMRPYSVLFITQESTHADCEDALTQGQTTSGVYVIKPDHQPAFQAYCDMDTDGGVPAQRGWISQLLLLLG